MLISEVTCYGKSMYGGWYIEYIDSEGNFMYENVRTLRNVITWMEEHGEDYRNINRFDNND